MAREGLALSADVRSKVMSVADADKARREGRLPVVACNTTGLSQWERGIHPDGSYTFPPYTGNSHGGRVALLEIVDRQAFQRLFPTEEYMGDRGDLVRGNRRYGLRPSVQGLLIELSPLDAAEVRRQLRSNEHTDDEPLMRVLGDRHRGELRALVGEEGQFMTPTVARARRFLTERLKLTPFKIALLVRDSGRNRGVQTLFGPEVVGFIESHPHDAQSWDDRTVEVHTGIPSGYIAAVVPLGRTEREAFE